VRRRQLRQKALQSLYQIDVGKVDVDSAVQSVFEGVEEAGPSDIAFVQGLVAGTVQAREEADRLLEAHVQGWRLDRIARVDLNILRLAIYELLYRPDVDVATVVDEAVELAKAFSTEESGRFVNGVLARILPVVEQRRQQSNTP
jgi:N utilization substance protein B